METKDKKRKSAAVITGTRAEFGLLRPVIDCMINEGVPPKLLVTGSHLAGSLGYTVSEIESGNYKIAKKIDILRNNAATPMATAFPRAFSGFWRYFSSHKTDIAVVLGDRYETLAAALAASMSDVPVAHISGGDVTEGAKDDGFRHCITKLSLLHFPSTERYRERIIQLGEHPGRVYMVGSLGAENAAKLPAISRNELSGRVGFDFNQEFLLATYHPETLADISPKDGIAILLAALKEISIPVLFTKANADDGGDAINRIISAFCDSSAECKLVDSLGAAAYLSAMRYAKVVVGNSSSAIVESPAFLTPAVNIGNRQKGREMGENVLNCQTDSHMIADAVKKAISPEFRKEIKNMSNPYKGDNVSGKITAHISSFLKSDIKDFRKPFYDLNFEKIGNSL